jgi:hypothetical protein
MNHAVSSTFPASLLKPYGHPRAWLQPLKYSPVLPFSISRLLETMVQSLVGTQGK